MGFNITRNCTVTIEKDLKKVEDDLPDPGAETYTLSQAGDNPKEAVVMVGEGCPGARLKTALIDVLDVTGT